MKCLIICSAISMSAITPSRKGRIASIESGVLPIISLASSPTAFTRLMPFNVRSEEHTSELQSLMRISYAVFCLKKKKQIQNSQYNVTIESLVHDQLNHN